MKYGEFLGSGREILSSFAQNDNLRPKIGVLDSGKGGLSVISDLFFLPCGADFVYFADDANFPYGTKTLDDVKKLVLNALNFFNDKNLDFLIIACNTMCSAAFPALQNYVNFPIFSIIDSNISAIKRHIDENMLINRARMLLFATNTTVSSKIYENLLNGVTVHSMELNPLVRMIENSDFVSARMYLQDLRQNFHDDFDFLVLGCTHFPLIGGIFAEIFKVPILPQSEQILQKISEFFSKPPDPKSSKKFPAIFLRYGDKIWQNYDMIANSSKIFSIQLHSSAQNDDIFSFAREFLGSGAKR